jgi:hypothetical protein
MNEEMTQCIEACLSCYKTCLSTAMNHCLQTGGLPPDDGLRRDVQDIGALHADQYTSS